MSEIKRVGFTTISSSVSSNIGTGSVSGNGSGAPSLSASGGNGAISAMAMATSSAALHRFGVPDPVTSQKSGSSITAAGSTGTGAGTTGTSKQNKTIRLNMELFASNSNSFPEFNYSKLIHLEKKKLKKLKNNKQNGFSDPFEDNDDDVARIAKELEKKYGTAYASGRGRSKKDDFCDIGLGYDENDSFIDNTEAYDEIIPEEVETVEGGFYINSGALVFKHLSSTEKTDEIIKMPNKTRKRALSSSSEESGSSDDEKDGDKETDGPTAITAASTSAVANPQQSAASKVSTSSSSKQKTALQSEKRHKTSSDKESSDKEKSSKSKSSAASSTATSSVNSLASGSPKNEDILSEPSSKDKDKDKSRVDRTVKTTTVKDMLKAKRDNFLKMQEEELKTKTSNGDAKAATSTEDASGSDSSSDESDSTQEPNAKKLKKGSEEDSDKLRPSDTALPDLADELLRDVQNIKDTAKASNRTGKKFQFDEKLTDIFLSVDERCLCLDKNIRNNVFAHLEYQLSLPKYFLLRKAKQLRINQEKTKTKKAFVKLRKAVAEIMQSINQQYQANVTKYEEFQSLHPGVDVHKLENAPKMPKKRFQWNDNSRTLLYDLYQVRWMSFTVLRTRKESFEDFVTNFLKDKVINIWPSGWMKLDELKREIEKKKNAPKKLKENKKPDESRTALSSTEKSQLLNQESAVSTSSKLSINTTDNHATASSSESSNAANLKPNDMTKLLPTAAHSNASAEHLHSSKAYSSSSGKLHRSSTSSPLNLCSGQSQSGSKSDKSASGSVTNNNNNANPNQNLNSNRSSTGTGIVNISKNPIDLVSPSKRTDHSINSIMSSPSSTSSSVSTTPQPQHSAGYLGNSLNVDNNTHVINIDNFKSASEIINTSNQLINHTTGKSHSLNERQKGGRSSGLDINSHNHSPLKAEFIRRDSSSESDGVEIVGVYQARSSSHSLPIVSKNKYKKSSHHGSRSDSPGLHDKLKTATTVPKKSLECTDLDVNKIMKALKELEELQQTGNFVPDISAFTNSNHNANTSPLAYGKDLTQ
ncbi:yemanuclein [Eupeodes corollae]|uniref:yemanuclein n=1 Tax=Eupeodes corollae TaxID=290404 RepID=UPI002491C9CF|nr:yemanuclein [Eupeodes corollae]